MLKSSFTKAVILGHAFLFCGSLKAKLFPIFPDVDLGSHVMCDPGKFFGNWGGMQMSWRVFVGGLALVAYVSFWPTLTTAQEDDVTTYTAERFAATVAETAVAGAAIEVQLDELLNSVAEIDAKVVEIIVRSQQLSSDKPTPPDTIDVASLQAYAEAWADRLSRLEAQVGAENELLNALSDRQDALRLLLREVELLQSWQGNVSPLLEEIARRVETGELDPEMEGVTALQSLAELEASQIELEQRIARDELASTTAKEKVETLQSTLEEETPLAERVQARLVAATNEEALIATYADLPEGERQSEFSTQRAELTQLEETRDARQQQFVDFVARKATAEAAVANLDQQTSDASIDAPADQADGAFADLRTAERLVTEGEARIVRLQEQVAALGVLAQETQGLQETETALVEDSARLVDTLTRVVLLAEVLEEQDALELRETLSSERETLQTLRQRLGLLPAELEDIQGRSAETAELVITAEDELMQLQQTAEEERVLARFLEDAEALSTPNLIAAFESALEERQGIVDTADELRGEARSQGRTQDEQQEQYEGFLNPIEVEFDPSGQAFMEWVWAQGLAETPTEEEPASTEANTGESAEQPRVFDAILQRDRARQDRTTARLSFYEQSQALREAYEGALSGSIAINELLAEELGRLVAISRQVWGSAAILRDRQLRGDLVDQDVPPQMDAWVSRDLILEANTDLAETREVISTLNAEIDRLANDGAAEQMIAPLRSLQQNYAERLQALANLTSFDAQLQTLEAPENLDEISRRIVDKDVRDRIETEHGLYGFIDNFISSDRLTDLDEILRRFYERLILLERQQQLIDDQVAKVSSVRESMDVSADAYVSLVERVSEEGNRVAQVLDLRASGLKIALNPLEATNLREAYLDRTGTEFPANAIPTFDESLDDEARTQAVQSAIASLRPIWTLAEGYSAWEDELRAFLEPLGTLDTEKREIDDILVNLNTQNEELILRVQGLIGISREALQGDQESQELTVEQRRLLAGEIGTLRFDREAVINRRALEAGFTLFVIPLIAFVLILIGSYLTRRFFKRLSTDNDGVLSPDRARRSETLSGTANTIWTVLVAALALIYMLGAVNVDVTPIIASLGVFGLAFAFGAQTIVKDMLSGLFLLMENQFNVGERVVVNGVTADVEKIGMRITTVRERETGLVHYISNGQIQSVANFNREFFRVFVNINIPYEIPPQRATQIIEEEIIAFKEHPEFAKHLHSLRLDNGITEFDYGMGALRYAVRMEIKGPVDDVHREFRRIIAERLHSLNIPLAVPIQIEVHEEKQESAPYAAKAGVEGIQAAKA